MASRILVSTLVAASIGASATAIGCRTNERFATTDGTHFEGSVVKGSFVRSGLTEDVQMCLTLDVNRLQDTPGTISTSDGRFQGALMRPIPQIWHDPLSTLSFGDGRLQNYVYAASPRTGDAGPAEAQDVFVFVSLMQSGGVEVRLLRGAPQTDAGAPPPGVAPAVFGVFTLDKRDGACAF